jgi:hypothetical protein
MRRHALRLVLPMVLLAGGLLPAGAEPVKTQSASLAPVPKVAEKVVSLVIEAGVDDGQPVLVRGRDARQQLVVTGVSSSGEMVDLTREVQYTATPPGIVSISPQGLVHPLGDGRAVIQALVAAGPTAKIDVTVDHYVDDPPLNFPNQIVPIFTKFGCNSGGCHGKSTGQNGFRLSLLGFEPGEDYEHLLKESRGRRLFPSAPERSLLLQKPINASPHGGGARMDADSHEYRLLLRWISQGMPYGKPTDPSVARISVFPRARSMRRNTEQQLIVLAHYTDGSTEDVSCLSQYDPNNPDMAEASSTGLIKTLDLTGEVAIMARYQGHVAVFEASIPLGVKVEKLPPARNFIDELVFKKLRLLGLPPSTLADDSTFIRRLTIDVAGRLPTVDETRQFLADRDPAKRDKAIDRLLASTDYADYFANKWNSILRNKRRTPNYTSGTYGFHAWIRDSLNNNLPYDEFVREIVGASGEMSDNPPVAWYREVKEVDQQVEDCAQLFLGLRIQCARCHHHPFEKWSQRDYYSFASFFSRVGRKGTNPDDQHVFHRRGVPSAVNPKTGESLPPAGLGAAPVALTPDRDPRQALVDWMTDPANDFFAPSLVNRYWKHFFSRGLVDPEDDMRVTNPASNPELLKALATHFVKSGFDLKDLVRTICQSDVYQLASEPNQYNRNDKQNFSRYYPKRLTAEVLLDALDSATASPSSFAGLPSGMRAVQLPDTSVGSYFLTVFGRPESSSACECERSQDANLAQSLHLLNSSEVQNKLSSGSGRAAAFAKDASHSPEENVRSIYLGVFSREPAGDELSVALGHIERAKNKQQAYEDILWALVNTKEFLFNH